MAARGGAGTVLRASVPFGLAIVVGFAGWMLWLIGRESESRRERAAARGEICDRLFTGLADEARVELGTAIGPRTDGACHEIDVDGVVGCLIRRHVDEDDPRNRNLRAYSSGPIESCQVLVESSGPRAIRFRQIREVGSAMRTFSIRVE